MYHVISIHAPHEGERLCARRCLKCTTRFQSTLPTRGSDKLNDESHTASNISIHAPHEGERPAGVYDENCEALFQSTLPTRGSDGGAGGGGGRKAHFNPRSPRGGATGWDCLRRWKRVDFNPRSPRGGATYARTSSAVGFTISIHAPHEGERQKQRLEAELQELFQSTLPTRGSDGGKVHLYAAFPRIY